MGKRAKILLKAGGIMEVVGEDGNFLASFEIKENLTRALELLKKMNGLKLRNGMPIYETRVYNGASVWAFHQHVIFWNHLREYVKFEPLLKFLFENGLKNAELEGCPQMLRKIISLNSIGKSSDLAREGAGAALRRFLAISFAFALTAVAFLKIIIFRPKLLVYTPDKFSKFGCDFRFAPVYGFLQKKEIKFVEVFHTLLNKEFYQNFLNRKRSAIYLEALAGRGTEEEFVVEAVDFSGWEPYNIAYFSYLLRVIDKRAQRSIKLTKRLVKLLKVTRIKKLIAIDDVRYANELVLACKMNGIPALAIQHGQLSKYYVGWLNYGIPKKFGMPFDTLYVWNDYWKKVLLEYSSHYDLNNVQVGGWLRELPTIAYKKREKPIADITEVRLLIPFESTAGSSDTAKEVAEYIKKFLNFGMKIYFKVRTDLDPGVQLEQYGLRKEAMVVSVKEMNAEVLGEVDAVAGVYSTFLNEMLFYDKPVFLLSTSFDAGHKLRDDGLATPLSLNFQPDDIVNTINNYQSKKDVAWPATQSIKIFLDKILK